MHKNGNTENSARTYTFGLIRCVPDADRFARLPARAFRPAVRVLELAPEAGRAAGAGDPDHGGGRRHGDAGRLSAARGVRRRHGGVRDRGRRLVFYGPRAWPAGSSPAFQDFAIAGFVPAPDLDAF